MHRAQTYLFAIVLFLLSALPVRADFISGDQLRLYCTSQDPNDDAICIVYITGAFDALTSMDQLAQTTSGATPQFCPSAEVGPEELKQLTLAYLQQPDTNLDFGASLLIWAAATQAFGCEK